MAKTKGKDVAVKVSIDDITYYTVSSINDTSMSFSGDNQDITAFGDDYITRIQGLKDVTYSMSGFFDVDDSTGQIAIRSALVDNTTLYAQVLMNGVAGYKQIVKPSSFEVSVSVDGMSELSIELEGTDTVTAV